MLGLAGILSIVGMLLIVAMCIAKIWLIVVAFKRSALWGLLALFIPFGALVFTIKYWQEARRPFLTGVATGVGAIMCVILSSVLAVKAVTPEMAQQMMAEAERQAAAESSMSTNRGTPAPVQSRSAVPTEPTSPVDAMPGSSGQGTEPATNSALSVLDSLPQTADSQDLARLTTNSSASAPGRAGDKKPVYDVDAVARDGFAPVALSDAGQLVGRRVKLVTTEGQVHLGEIRRADGNSVSLERWLRGGSAVLDFSRAEIQSLHVRAN